MGIDDLDGGCSSGAEIGAVITKNVQAGTHGLFVQIVDACQIFYVFILDGELKLSGEDLNCVVDWRLKGFSGSRRG